MHLLHISQCSIPLVLFTGDKNINFPAKVYSHVLGIKLPPSPPLKPPPPPHLSHHPSPCEFTYKPPILICIHVFPGFVGWEKYVTSLNSAYWWRLKFNVTKKQIRPYADWLWIIKTKHTVPTATMGYNVYVCHIVPLVFFIQKIGVSRYIFICLDKYWFMFVHCLFSFTAMTLVDLSFGIPNCPFNKNIEYIDTLTMENMTGD